MNARQLRIPYAGVLGGRRVWVRADPVRDADGNSGTLAADVKIRGVRIPAGSELSVAPRSGDTSLRLLSSVTVRGVSLPGGSKLLFSGRPPGPAPMPPGSVDVAAQFPLVYPWLWWQSRQRAVFARAVLAGPINLHGRLVAAGSALSIQRDGMVFVCDGEAAD